MMNDKKYITPEEAISLLNDGEEIHTFRNTRGMVIGCDWDRESIIKTLHKYSDSIELCGETCRKLEHGIAVNVGEYLFIETNPEKLDKFDPI